MTANVYFFSRLGSRLAMEVRVAPVLNELSTTGPAEPPRQLLSAGARHLRSAILSSGAPAMAAALVHQLLFEAWEVVRNDRLRNVCVRVSVSVCLCLYNCEGSCRVYGRGPQRGYRFGGAAIAIFFASVARSGGCAAAIARGGGCAAAIADPLFLRIGYYGGSRAVEPARPPCTHD